jgi:AcrR family transcriptional regulator
MPYHHGSLREDLLAAAAKAVAERGPDGLSLRELARELGVTHTAPRHHFGDKRGVITALAAQGYRLLAGRLRSSGGDFLEAGVAYVRFALDHPGHFAVMFRPDLVDEEDHDLAEARLRARQALIAGTAAHARAAGREGAPAAVQPAVPGGALPPYALLAWSAAHGIASLALAGALTALGLGGSKEELTALARASLQHLGPP